MKFKLPLAAFLMLCGTNAQSTTFLEDNLGTEQSNKPYITIEPKTGTGTRKICVENASDKEIRLAVLKMALFYGRRKDLETHIAELNKENAYQKKLNSQNLKQTFLDLEEGDFFVVETAVRDLYMTETHTIFEQNWAALTQTNFTYFSNENTEKFYNHLCSLIEEVRSEEQETHKTAETTTVNIAKKMRQQNIPDETIAAVTGFSLEVLQKVLNQGSTS